ASGAPAEGEIVPPLGGGGVFARLAEELVIARPAGERVVAVAAEDQGSRQDAVGFIEADGVVAGQTEHADGGSVGDGGSAANDVDCTAVDEDIAGVVAADGDRVVAGVAQDGQ